MKAISSHSRAAVRAICYATAVAGFLLLSPALASACARDGIPSVSADGRLAVLNRSSVTPGLLSSWSPFVFAQAVRHGQAITLAENNREVARAMPPEVFKRPWQWDFGDRSKLTYGTRVRHTYSRPGTYHIVVRAYFASYRSWQPFDSVTIHVR